MNVLFPIIIGPNSFLIPILTMSNLAFKPSLDLPEILSKVPRRLSNIFYSICITSIKCLTYNEL
ncbi:hypothetical protein Lalb_Chr13g0293261 [Lupinus albus]|uniref:Uncharacterized protein n=1 Tax=Lupinus albus TaxID=3870 RepID=A0A6A4PHS6_LUPAL|nr:hypothetical protein Lalb_Chr13g0293261 [Lupinus albus]